MNVDQQQSNEIEAFVRSIPDFLSSKYKWTAEIKGIGIDIVPVHRIASLIDRYERETLNLLFTPGEIELCQAGKDNYRFYAVCFAAKEAVGKALGTGLAGIGWNQIEASIIHGQLSVSLHGEARIQAKRLGIREWLADWFHWNEHVLVHVLAQ